MITARGNDHRASLPPIAARDILTAL